MNPPNVVKTLKMSISFSQSRFWV